MVDDAGARQSLKTNTLHSGEQLTSLTERVGYVTGQKGKRVYHAPTGDGALCGAGFDRVVRREILESHYRPCKHCFAVDES